MESCVLELERKKKNYRRKEDQKKCKYNIMK